MNKYEIKKLFWNIVKEVEGCSDCTIQNDKCVVIERGMLLADDYSIMFGLDDGILRIYNKEKFPIAAFTEESEVPIILKNLFENLKIFKKIALEVPVQELSNVTFDFGVIEPSRFYMTTDKSFYDGMKENPKFVPMFTPNDFKESLRISKDFQLYIFRVSQE